MNVDEIMQTIEHVFDDKEIPSVVYNSPAEEHRYRITRQQWVDWKEGRVIELTPCETIDSASAFVNRGRPNSPAENSP